MLKSFITKLIFIATLTGTLGISQVIANDTDCKFSFSECSIAGPLNVGPVECGAGVYCTQSANRISELRTNNTTSCKEAYRSATTLKLFSKLQDTVYTKCSPLKHPNANYICVYKYVPKYRDAECPTLTLPEN